MNIKNIISAIAVSGTLLAGLSGCEAEYQPDYEARLHRRSVVLALCQMQVRHRRHGDEADDQTRQAANGTCNRYAGLRPRADRRIQRSERCQLPSLPPSTSRWRRRRHPARREQHRGSDHHRTLWKRPMTSSMHCPRHLVRGRSRIGIGILVEPYLSARQTADPVGTADDVARS